MPSLPTVGGDRDTWGTKLNEYLTALSVGPQVIWNVDPGTLSTGGAAVANTLYLTRLPRQPVDRTITAITWMNGTTVAGNCAASIYTNPATDLSTAALLDASTFTEVASGTPVANGTSDARQVFTLTTQYSWASGTDIWIGWGSDAAHPIVRHFGASLASFRLAAFFRKTSEYSAGLPSTVTGPFSAAAGSGGPYLLGVVTTSPGP